MNRKAYVSILALIFLMGCGGSEQKKVTPVVSITATSGTLQSAAGNTAFAAPMVATVTTGGSPTSGVAVTFTAPATGASGTFANGKNTETDTTNASGVATSTTFTANGTAGGPYTVTATAAGVATAANFSLTNTPAVPSNYSFYATGMERVNGGPNFYAIAGAVTIDPNGNVLAGEQDYNNAWTVYAFGDTITGGTLTVDAATGQGTLTLITSNSALGASGTETLGVQFVNTKHALISQFDGTATSSGSMDLQTLPSTLSGGYAFTVFGVGGGYFPAVAGGVFSINGAGLSGVFDMDDAGAGIITKEMPFSGTMVAPDSFGRGTIYNFPGLEFAYYYVVGPEAIRIIGMEFWDFGVFIGSAFGQGTSTGTFNNASLGNSAFGIASGNVWSNLYAAAGMFSTIPSNGTIQGVADNDEAGVVWSGSPISGTYSIASNGYGSLTITPGDLGDISALGIYMADPHLNLNDPNNTTSGLGGALVANLDTNAGSAGAGVLIPQTDTSTASFAGNYAFGAQTYYSVNSHPGGEFDLVGQGSVTGGVLTGTGLVSDPSSFFATTMTVSGVTFSGSAAPDVKNVGRYTMFTSNPFVITPVAGSPVDFQVVIYQASGGQLFWVDEDGGSLFLGSLQRQGSLSGIPAAKRAAAKYKPKQKLQ